VLTDCANRNFASFNSQLIGKPPIHDFLLIGLESGGLSGPSEYREAGKGYIIFGQASISSAICSAKRLKPSDRSVSRAAQSSFSKSECAETAHRLAPERQV